MNVAGLYIGYSKISAFQTNGRNQLVVSEINSVGHKQHYF